MPSIWDGITIGGAGGAIAGVTVWLVQHAHAKVLDCRHKRRVYDWLSTNTEDEIGHRYRTTRAIASWNNLTEDRVRSVGETSAVRPSIRILPGVHGGALRGVRHGCHG